MMRAALVGTGTVVGVGVVLGLNPTGTTSAALGIPLVPAGLTAPNGSNFGPVAPAGSGSTATPTASATPQPSGTPSPEQHASRTVPSHTPAPTRTRTRASAAPTRSPAPNPSPTATAAPKASPSPSSVSAVGPPIDVGYGIVQVKIILSGGSLVDVQPVQLPYDNPYSQSVSQQAWPILRQEALQAQSAQIANVTNASYTTEGFKQSLRAALLALGHAA